MNAKEQNTEEKILQAAEQVFTEKGLYGARMQDIADRAGINKALLHYYYRSKSRLFMAVFKTIFPRVIPPAFRIFKTDLPLFEKIRIFTDAYITILLKNRKLPLFVIAEFTYNQAEFVQFMSEFVKNLDFDLVNKFKKDVQTEIEKGTIIEIDYRELFINMLSMSVFPFVAQPVIQRIGFENNQKAYLRFLRDRKKNVAEFIISAIKKNA